MLDTNYGYTKIIENQSFEKTLESLTSALQAEGFGVLTEIDVKATLKKKLDLDFRNYKILGACNPLLAHQALSHELFLGLLLPCNVVVFDTDEGNVAVSIIKPPEMFKVVNNPDMDGIVAEVDARVQRVLDKL